MIKTKVLDLDNILMEERSYENNLLYNMSYKNLIAKPLCIRFDKMFYQIFLSPQVKRCPIITYKHGIYELPHELTNDLRLRILGNIK